MENFICVQCGTQFGETMQPPSRDQRAIFARSLRNRLARRSRAADGDDCSPQRKTLVDLFRANIVREISNLLPEEIDLVVYV